MNARGFPCLIQFPAEHIQLSSGPPKVNLIDKTNKKKIIVNKIITKIIFDFLSIVI